MTPPVLVINGERFVLHRPFCLFDPLTSRDEREFGMFWARHWDSRPAEEKYLVRSVQVWPGEDNEE